MKVIEGSEYPPITIVICTKLDRFARSMLDLLVNVQALDDKGIKFSTLTNEFETKTAIGKLTMGMLGLFATFERDLIEERTREGYRAAIAKGTICHRPKIKVDKKKVLDIVIEKGMSASSAAKLLGVTTNTIKSRLNEWNYYFDDKQNNWVKKEKDV